MAVFWTTPLFLTGLFVVIMNYDLARGASITGHLQELVRDIRATIDKVSASATGQKSSLREGRRIENFRDDSKQSLEGPEDAGPMLWWDGPSVCVNRTKIGEKSNETTVDRSPAASTNSSGHAILTMCRIVGNRRHCRTRSALTRIYREAVNGSNFEEFSTTYECCKGFVLRYNHKCVLGNDTESAIPLDDETEDDDTGTDNLLGRFLEESIRTQSLMLRALDAGAPSNDDSNDEQLMPVLVFRKKTLPTDTVQSRIISQSSSKNSTNGNGSSELSSRSDLHFSVTI